MNKKKLLQLVRAKEDEIRAQRFESAFFWDGHGTLVLSKEGEVDRITFSDEELALMTNTIATHNHPHGWRYAERDPRRGGYSFSAKDVQLACQHSLILLRVVTPKFRHMIKPPPQGWNQNYWETTLGPEYSRLYDKVKAKLKAKVNARQILQAEAESLFRHEVLVRVAKRLAIEYTREEF